MEVLTLVCTNAGLAYYRDREGFCWRLLVFLDGTVSYDRVKDERLAWQGGRGFGRFLALLSDLDTSLLNNIIPGFHDLRIRLNQLEEVLALDPLNRAFKAEKELQFLFSRSARMGAIGELGKAGQLPLRTTHNDTKFNNLLFDREGKVRCVVDLDTVMSGYIAYDFGDAVRSLANSGPENAQDLAEVRFNKALCESFTRGFIRETTDSLSSEEVESLAEGCLLMPYLLGMRFLTDYIGGDRYFKADYHDHNLSRARVQFRLFELIERERGWLAGLLKQSMQSS